MESQNSTPEVLIDTAGRIFAAKGVTATVREICGAAGCSVAAISYYFGDKQQLYLRCVQAACERKQRLYPVPHIDDQLPPQEALRVFLQAIAARVASQADESWHNSLMLREILTPSEGVAGMLQANFKSDFDLLNSVLSRLLGARLDSVELRQSLATQVFARCMFLRTGKELRRLLDFSSPANEDPRLYADDICDSILLQIEALRPQCDVPVDSTPYDNTSSSRDSV